MYHIPERFSPLFFFIARFFILIFNKNLIFIEKLVLHRPDTGKTCPGAASPLFLPLVLVVALIVLVIVLLILVVALVFLVIVLLVLLVILVVLIAHVFHLLA